MSRLTTGSLLKDLFAVFLANIVPFLMIAAIAQVPLVVVLATGPATVGQFAATVIQYAMTQVATAAITYGVYRQLRGQSSSVGACLAVALRRMIPVVLVGVLSSFAVGLGTLLFIVPGLIIATMLFVAVPVVVVERRGVIEAMDRSTKLSAGHRWTIFFVILFLFALQFGGSMLTVAGTMATGWWGFGVQLAFQAVVTALQATAAALVYYRIREEKENLDLEAVASVFA